MARAWCWMQTNGLRLIIVLMFCEARNVLGFHWGRHDRALTPVTRSSSVPRRCIRKVCGSRWIGGWCHDSAAQGRRSIAVGASHWDRPDAPQGPQPAPERRQASPIRTATCGDYRPSGAAARGRPGLSQGLAPLAMDCRPFGAQETDHLATHHEPSLLVRHGEL